MLEDFERNRIASFFSRIVDQTTPEPRFSTIAITHLLSDRPVFLRAIASMSHLCAVLPKPKSIDSDALTEAASHWPVDKLDRCKLAAPDEALAYLVARGRRAARTARRRRILRSGPDRAVRPLLG